MALTLHWFLPTNGDSRTDLSLGNAVGAAGSRVTATAPQRAPDIGYIGQIARSAEQLGFSAALTPTSSWCEDAWVMTAALTQVTERFRYLVAFRPGLMSPTLAAHMAATYQRISGGRLLLNIVTGGDDVEQQRFGDHLGKHERYRRCAEFLHVAAGAVDRRAGRLPRRLLRHPRRADRPRPGLAGHLPRRLVRRRARRRGRATPTSYLTWGEPPAAVGAEA